MNMGLKRVPAWEINLRIKPLPKNGEPEILISKVLFVLDTYRFWLAQHIYYEVLTYVGQENWYVSSDLVLTSLHTLHHVTQGDLT